MTTDRIHTSQPASDRSWLPLVLVCLAALATHGLLLINDGVYWDGWLVYWLCHDGNWPELVRWSNEAGGLPVPLLLRRTLGSLPDPSLGFKLAAFVSLLGAAHLVYLLAHRIRGLTRWESVMLALLSLVYPAYQASVEMNSTKYLVTYAIFLGGGYLGCRAESMEGKRHASLRIASTVLFILSFGTASLLAFYLGYLAIWLAHGFAVRQLTRASILPWLLRRSDVLLLPIAYRIAVPWLFPSVGKYEGYNAVAVSHQLLSEGFEIFHERSISYQWSAAIARLSEQPWVAAGAFLVAVVVFFCASAARFTPASTRQHFAAIGFALGLLFLGMLPYVLVGKPAWRHGWSSRHALLIALPMALLVLSVMRAICAGRQQALQRVGFAALGACVWLFTVSVWSYYVSWQARWVKDLSVIVQMRAAPAEVRSHSTFWVIDQYPVSPEIRYEFYEWASMFKLAWGDESHIGIDLRTPGARDFLSEGKAYFGPRYQLSGFNPAGSQATLAISPGSMGRTEAMLVLGYWQARFLRPESLPEFLHGVVTVSVHEGAATIP